MKRVLFVSDFDLKEAPGGAQISNSEIIKTGQDLGYQITEHFHNSSITDFLSHYDLLISSNMAAIAKSADKINFILKHKNHVRLEHDSCQYLTEQGRKLIFGSSKKNFFLSDFHLSFFKQLYGDIFGDTEIIYDPIDTEIFKKSNLEKIYDVVYCGYLHPDKGFQNLLEFAERNTNRKIDVFGMADKIINVKSLDSLHNITVHDQWLEKEQVAKVFQQSNAVFHSPIVNEPFCRMVAEAILCGVEEIIGSPNKIGSCLEFQKVGYNEFSNSCKNAANKFWQKVNL